VHIPGWCSSLVKEPTKVDLGTCLEASRKGWSEREMSSRGCWLLPPPPTAGERRAEGRRGGALRASEGRRGTDSASTRSPLAWCGGWVVV
jgi:hypothetical protein